MKYSLLLMALTALLLASCVSSRKYVNAKIHISELRQDSMRLARSLSNCQDTTLALHQNVGDLNDKLQKLIQAAKTQISSQKNQLNSSKQQIAEQEQKLAALQAILQKQKEVTERLRKTITDALMKFKSDELTVFEKNGKVYVSMQEKLLFKSGSAVVDPKGKEALSTVAQVLNANPNIKIEVEGHTDSIPIRGRFADNWALSLARAASVTRILTRDYQVDPTRVTASGHSKYDPVETNSTEEGRAHNRRTDIILAPNLDELYQLINQQQGSPADTGATGKSA
ncbi:MAG TPA: OmpA family protein [Chitinophagaceae bacterium]|jgi:chemotaxis protein MotB|nr:OmpA family protein [Chitinophagaceae bacterium]